MPEVPHTSRLESVYDAEVESCVRWWHVWPDATRLDPLILLEDATSVVVMFSSLNINRLHLFSPRMMRSSLLLKALPSLLRSSGYNLILSMVKSRLGIVKSLACITAAHLQCNSKNCHCECHYWLRIDLSLSRSCLHMLLPIATSSFIILFTSSLNVVNCRFIYFIDLVCL